MRMEPDKCTQCGSPVRYFHIAQATREIMKDGTFCEWEIDEDDPTLSWECTNVDCMSCEGAYWEEDPA